MSKPYVELPDINVLFSEQSSAATIVDDAVIDQSGNLNLSGIEGETGDGSNFELQTGFYEQETDAGVPFLANSRNATLKFNIKNQWFIDNIFSGENPDNIYVKQVMYRVEIIGVASAYDNYVIPGQQTILNNPAYIEDINVGLGLTSKDFDPARAPQPLTSFEKVLSDFNFGDENLTRDVLIHTYVTVIKDLGFGLDPNLEYPPLEEIQDDIGMDINDYRDYEMEKNDLGQSVRVQPEVLLPLTSEQEAQFSLDQEAAVNAYLIEYRDNSAPIHFGVEEEGFVVEGFPEITIYPAFQTDSLGLQATFLSFGARIDSVSEDGTSIFLNQTWNDFINKTGDIKDINPNSGLPVGLSTAETFENWNISYKINDRRVLNTYLHLGDDKLQLITNVKSDTETFPDPPHAIIYKLYEPLPTDINPKDKAYVVREILPQYTETIELIPYEGEEDVLVLKIPDTPPDASPITKREVSLKTFDDLVTTDAVLKEGIIDKFISGSEKPVELSVDYSQYENFINFSSAQKRLENFKYKIERIEQQTALSSSFVGVTSGSVQSSIHRSEMRNIKSNFDGYESYLYNTVSTYLTSSMGEFNNASWPKTGSGTYLDPYVPVSSSHADFTSWYGSIPGKTGQLYSASLYDTENENRLVSLLPQHISEDLDNSQFLSFMDMIGQQFDELWSYISAMTNITDRNSDLTEGFSKDLIYNLAKSLGWESQDGKDLLDLSQAGFGQKLEGDSFSLYTSGSLNSPPEGDVSKEITKRLIASMPYLLKTKGTVGSLKGLLNIYGIPSTILRVREYGGLSQPNQRDAFEVSRRFTKALGFRGAQYVSSSWSDDSTSGRKPETVELRFRSVSGSNQTLVQKDSDWAIRLKDNGSVDNYGTVSFILSGSTGQKEVSSSLLPVFDGDYYSLMLQKRKVETNLFPQPSFEVGSAAGLFNPPFVTQSFAINSAAGGEIEVVSGSNVARTATKSLRHINTNDISSNAASFTLFSSNPSSTFGSSTAAITDAVAGETFTFSAYAKVSASLVNSAGRLRIFELDSNEEVVDWNEDTGKSNNSTLSSLTSLGGIKSSADVGLNETEWIQIQVTKTIQFSNTAKLGIRFENLKPQSTIYWDDVYVGKNPSNTDAIGDTFNYELYVKKYESGLDRTIFSSNTSLLISGSNTASQSFNAAWTGSGDLFIGGSPSDQFGNQLTGSIMEFRLWNEPLQEIHFDTHVANPKSYVGNTPSSSYYSLIRRYSFDDNSVLANGASIRDVSSDQTDTLAGFAHGWAGVNAFESVEDKTKTMIPNYGPNRRSSTKIRIENNVLSGSSANLSVDTRFDVSSNDFAPLDSPKVGIYFSPTDVVNEDIILSFANLDFNQYLGDPRDNFKLQYPELKDISTQYFQKYAGKNNFWDYMRLIKYYDQMMFTQIRKLIPARSKPHLGTVIEPNLFERSKNPVQRNQPSFTLTHYEKTLNVSNMHFNDEPNVEASHSVFKISTEYPNYEGTIEKLDSPFALPSLYRFGFNDNYDDRATYVSASMKVGSNREFQEVTMSIVMDSRKSELNQEYKFFYTSSNDYDNSSRYSIDPFVNLYTSRSLHISELDAGYQDSSALNRSFYEGVKNTKTTTLDGDLPVVIRTTSPTVAVPSGMGDSNLTVLGTGNKSSSGKRNRGFSKKMKGNKANSNSKRLSSDGTRRDNDDKNNNNTR